LKKKIPPLGTTKILIVRTSSLGDVVQALPVLRALRRHGPRARIAWLVEEAFSPLLAGHPDLDQVIPVRLRAWRQHPFARRTLRELRDFFRSLDRFAPEVVLDLMGNHKAGVLAALTLADRRIGVEKGYRREPSSVVWISETVRPRSRHSVDKMLAVLDALDLPREPAEFGGRRLPTNPTDEIRSRSPAESPVLIHPGAGWDNKRYPPEKWGQVAHLIHHSTGARCGVVIARGEENLAQRAIEASQGAAEAMAAPDLPQLTDLLRQSRLVLGGDTGPIHLAHALERPVLCLMGPTDPRTCGPYGAPQTVIWRQLPCSFCHKRYGRIMPCLEEISPAEIADRAQRILADRPLPGIGPVEEGESGCLVLH
jgi:lipopolysaccharide heptosyltransferase I